MAAAKEIGMEIFRFWRWRLDPERPAYEHVVRDHADFAPAGVKVDNEPVTVTPRRVPPPTVPKRDQPNAETLFLSS